MALALEGRKIAILAADGVERVELDQPRGALDSAGATTDLVSIHLGEIQARQCDMIAAGRFTVDRLVRDASVNDYDALLLPGGTVNPDRLRIDTDAVAFVRAFVAAGKPVAAICHGSRTLVEADVVRGKRLTSWPSLHTDLRNAGAVVVDQEVCVDGQLTTGRSPADLPAFCAAIVQQLRGPTGPGQRIQTPLHTEHGKIIDAVGNEVQLTGVTWFGLETDTFAPHGLWMRNWADMLDQMAGQGFNTLRLPYSNDLFNPACKPNGIDYGRNPDLVGATGPLIMDKIVDGATRRGIMVMLDRHRPTSAGQRKFWYTDQVSETTWIKDWTDLARRYRDNPLVIGADLHNEPHDEASWGDGNKATDWRLAAERAGNAILATNPDWLIIVEGVQHYEGKGYWWGGNLTGARDHPVRLSDPSKLVYSAHDYSPNVWPQPWFNDPTFPDNLPAVWDAEWGYLAKEHIAPVVLGEFGGWSVGTDLEGVWQRSLVDYVKNNGISYTYWCWNPNSPETGGVLADDWATVNTDKMNLLKSYQAPMASPRTPVSA
jgi:endoglucanase